jgi:hypothetical protein
VSSNRPGDGVDSLVRDPDVPRICSLPSTQVPHSLRHIEASSNSSLGGLGGRPYAPGASGNVVTEDLVFICEAMGVATGIELDELIAARELLRTGLPGEPIYGMTPEAGLPKAFAAASKASITPD